MLSSSNHTRKRPHPLLPRLLPFTPVLRLPLLPLRAAVSSRTSLFGLSAFSLSAVFTRAVVPPGLKHGGAALAEALPYGPEREQAGYVMDLCLQLWLRSGLRCDCATSYLTTLPTLGPAFLP